MIPVPRRLSVLDTEAIILSMTNEELIDEESQAHGLELQCAILHLLDGRRRNIVFSEDSLDLEDAAVEAYVKRYVSRCMKDMKMCPGTFRPDSAYAKLVQDYFHQRMTLASAPAAMCEPLVRYFENEEARSFAVLAADFREDDVPWFALILLEEAETITAITDAGPTGLRNTISFGHASLPAVSRPITCYAIVNMLNGELRFADGGKWKDKHPLIRETLLDAEAGISKKEVVRSVSEITQDLAEEFQENPTVLLSRVKSYISDTVKEGIPLNTETLAREVFEETPKIAKAFHARVEETALPKEIELPRAAVSASLRRQKIKTDTGIEISFPAEYFNNSDYIEFITHSDGTTTIEIRKIGKITNKI